MTDNTRPTQGTVLLVDDNREFVESTHDILNMIDYQVVCAYDVAEAKQKLQQYKFTHLFLDLMLPDGSGINVLDGLTKTQLESTSITIITGHPAVKTVVKSLYGPKVNYLIKPITFRDLKKALAEPVKLSEQEASNSPQQSPVNEVALIGESKEMQQLRRTITLVAETDANVMLLGESGVGKEVVARMIHNESQVSGQLISTNCGALNRELVTSELFGHEKGAFTGAVGRKSGVFELAHMGTLFLDEVTEMPIDLQPNLLRALETQTIVRLGGSELIPANCRVISASNRTESELAEKNCLREDLYFRLAVFPVYIPPLRERKGDIAILARHFISELNNKHNADVSIRDDTMEVLESYSWPGNVRELRHTLHRALILTEPGNQYLQLPDKLSSPFSTPVEVTNHRQVEVGRSLEDVERDLINLTLESFNGDKTKSAKVLGISTKTLYNRLNAYQKNNL